MVGEGEGCHRTTNRREFVNETEKGKMLTPLKECVTVKGNGSVKVRTASSGVEQRPRTLPTTEHAVLIKNATNSAAVAGQSSSVFLLQQLCLSARAARMVSWISSH